MTDQPAPAPVDPALLDRPLGFAVPEHHARGRLVRLGPVLSAILSAHRYPPVIERTLAEALVLAALLGATLKDAGGQLTIQAQTQGGPIELLVVDYRGGELRGYIKFDAERVAAACAENADAPPLPALFGEGYLALTFDQTATGERYQGIVPLEGADLAAAAEHYFVQSEQLPSLLRIGVEHLADGGCIAGGLLVQHLPEGEEGRERLHVRLDHPEWDHVRALAETVTEAELTDPVLPLATLLWRLFNADAVRVTEGTRLTRGCRCDPEHLAGVLRQFPAAERAAMADETGAVVVDCAFCSRLFPIPLTELEGPAPETP